MAEAADAKTVYVQSNAVFTAQVNGKNAYGSYKTIAKYTTYSDLSVFSIDWWSIDEHGIVVGSGNNTFNKVYGKWLLNMSIKLGSVSGTGTAELEFKENDLTKAHGIAKTSDKMAFDIEVDHIATSYHLKVVVTNAAGEEIRKDDLHGFTITEEEFNKILNHK